MSPQRLQESLLGFDLCPQDPVVAEAPVQELLPHRDHWGQSPNSACMEALVCGYVRRELRGKARVPGGCL